MKREERIENKVKRLIRRLGMPRWLHLFCAKKKMEAHIPLKNYGRPKHKRRSARRKSALAFRERTYHRISLIESGFSSIKRKYGHSVSSKNAGTIKAEVYGRLLCHNLFGYFI